MVAFLPVVFSLVSAADYECKPTKEGPQFQCEININDNVKLYVGRSEGFMYLGASTTDARWLSVGVGPTMKNMLQFVNHEDPKYLEQQKNKDGQNTHLDADDSYRGGSRLFKGHPKGITKGNANEDNITFPKAPEVEAFKRSFFSFGSGGRKTHIQLTREKAEKYDNTISIAWGEDSEDVIVHNHGNRKKVLSLGSEDGSDEGDIELPEELGAEIDAKFESDSRISGAQTLCVVSVSALLALLI